MNKGIDYFFDFMSPFCYLAHHRLPQIAQRYDCVLTYKPIDLQAAKIAAGNTGPSTRNIPPKARYGLTDIHRWAKRYDVPFQLPKSYQSERLNKGTFFAIDRKVAGDYVQYAGYLVFGLGGDMSDEALLRDVANKMAWPVEEFLQYTLSDDAAQRYAKSNSEAQARGVFGVPAMFIDDEMWWGNDRLTFVDEYLNARRS